MDLESKAIRSGAAHDKLAKEGRPKTVANATVKTWADYCEEAQISGIRCLLIVGGEDYDTERLPELPVIDDEAAQMDHILRTTNVDYDLRRINE